MIYPSLSAYENPNNTPVYEDIFLSKSVVVEKAASAPLLLLIGKNSIIIHDTRQEESYSLPKGLIFNCFTCFSNLFLK